MISAATIADLRRLERKWVTADDSNRAARRLEFEAHLRSHAHDLLAASEAVCRLLAERRYPTPGFTDADRVRFLDRVLNEMEATC